MKELKERFEEIALRVLGECTCGEIYLSRKMSAPDCAYHNCHDDLIDELESVYVLDRNEWVSVDERLPETPQMILVGYWYKDEFLQDVGFYDGLTEYSFTHWQYLPKPPIK